MTNRFPLALALATAALFALPLSAAEPWEATPFSADPKALLEAARKVDAGKADLILLLDEATYTFDENGASRVQLHYVYRVVTAKGTSSAREWSARWVPWYADRPRIHARVVAADASVHTLDPSTVADASAELQHDIFSDERVVHAPLPGVGAGSVVEVVSEQTNKSVIPGAGTTAVYQFGGWLPTEKTRLVLDGPAGFDPHLVNKTSAQPRVAEKDGRKQFVFESGPIAAITDSESYLPPDEQPGQYVAFSTGSSWGELAKRYAEIVDKQIAAGDVRAAAAAATRGAKDRQEVVARLLAYVQANVHYAGVEMGDGSIVPRPPAAVLQNKYGDCKDKATLLAALLRASGLPAHVVLLNSGTGFDVLPALPGLSRFNHAIVVVGGATPIWIDPTDEFERAGTLPTEDQGRLALIADAGTTSLTRTPEPPPDTIIETRTFTLPEEGKARVVEVTEGTGVAEAALRRHRARSESEKYKEAQEKYGKSYYLAEKIDEVTTGDPRDLTKPFSVTIAMTRSKSGVIYKGEGSVAAALTDLFSPIPEPLRDYKEPRPGDEASAAKKRVHDFAFHAFTKEWRYRIVLPPGFRARTLPENETKHLGTATLAKEFGTGADGVLFATFRFDAGKRRLTPAELEETRIAVSRALEGPVIQIGFESVGQAKLNAGDIRGALEEFRRLAALHPKEAQHHIELARALLAGGLGEAAREEARRAVAVEPSSARAHGALGEVLEHDFLGREFRGEFDLAAATAELRKGKELDPKDIEIRSLLAETLSYGDDGSRYGRNAHLADAIYEYKALLNDFGPVAHAYQPRLMIFLAHARRWDEMKAFVETMENGEQKTLGRLLALAGGSGVAAASRALEGFAITERRQYANAVAGSLIPIGMYAEAADMFDLASRGAESAPEAQWLSSALRKAKPDAPDDGTPRGSFVRLLHAFADGDKAAIKELVSKDSMSTNELRDTGRLRPPVSDMTPSQTIDLLLAIVDVQTAGNDAVGYRLRVNFGGGGTDDTMSMYAQREGTKYVFHAASTTPSSIGEAALKLAEAGRLDAARTWLNWAREEIVPGGGDDPLASSPFPALWAKEKQTATADEIRVAAAALMSTDTSTAAKALPILTAARDKAADDRKPSFDAAILSAFDDPKAAIDVAARLMQSHPESSTAFVKWASALAASGKGAEAEAAAKVRLERSPRDRAALTALHDIAARKGDYDAAAAYARRIVTELNPTESDYNNSAWTALFARKEIARAIEDARRASEAKHEGRAASLHTLAALYAESGKSLEARQALLESMDARSHDRPASEDWYVLGRIAENYGVPDAALAAYKRVEKKTPDGLTTWELTQRRLAALAKK